MHCKRPNRLASILIAAMALAAATASAQTLYKLIDKNGKVTYSEAAPKNFDGQVIRLEIDPNANIATLPKPAAKGESARVESENEKIIRQRPGSSPGREERIRQAQARLDAARKAFDDARDNPGEDDSYFVANAPTGSGSNRQSHGVRRVPTEQYAARLEALDQAVTDAQEALKRVERDLDP